MLRPSFQQNFAVWGISTKFGVDVLLIMPSVKLIETKVCDLCMTSNGVSFAVF